MRTYLTKLFRRNNLKKKATQVSKLKLTEIYIFYRWFAHMAYAHKYSQTNKQITHVDKNIYTHFYAHFILFGGSKEPNNAERGERENDDERKNITSILRAFYQQQAI